jgi:NIMA-interacting peptidyl-prolyl cis-trans isomerase 1
MSVRASHILCKHTGSRNPVSRRTGLPVTQSPSSASAEIGEILSRLQASPPGEGLAALFADVARGRSDCGSFANGGDLGDFERGQMQEPFENASFGLKVGEMSGVVSTDSGLHIILRTA